ncbi:MAG: methyltransferase domain-containing protein [Alphaproteobacteria bacterium]
MSQTNFDLGEYHLQKGNLNDAILRFKIASLLKPNNAYAYYNLGRSLYLKDQKIAAKDKFLFSLKLNSELKEAKYFLSVIDEQYDIPEEIPLSIIKEYYNNIEYLPHNKSSDSIKFIIEKIVSLYFLNTKLSILELGIGDGNFGEELRIANSEIEITGVDVAHSAIKNLNLNVKNKLTYNYLIEDDFYEYLRNNTLKFDVIVALNSLVYNKNLNQIISLISKHLNSDSLFVFSSYKSNDETIKFDKSKQYFIYPTEYFQEILSKHNISIIELKNFQNESSVEEMVLICKLK